MAKRSHFGLTSILVAATSLSLVAGSARAQVACDGFVNLGGAPDDSVFALHTMPNGDIIAAGEFENIGEVATGLIARWNGSTWEPIGTGGPMQGSVRAIAATPDGFVIVGTFRMAPTEPMHQVAHWNGVTWTLLDGALPYQTPQDGPWFSGAFRSNIAVLPNGNIVAATNEIGSPSYVSLWDGTTWSIIGQTSAGGLLDIIGQPSLVVLPNGDLVMAFQFLSINGVVVNNVARWDGTAWHAMGAGLPGPVRAMHLKRDGTLVAAIDTQTPWERIHTWNGSAWQSDPNSAPAFVRAMKQHPTGPLVVAGQQSNAFHFFNAGSWESVGQLPFAANSIAFDREGRIILGNGGFGLPSIRRYDGCFCPADLGSSFWPGYRDGAVTIDDLLYFLVAFEGGLSAADLDNDGDAEFGEPDAAVTIEDLLFYLARFEAGC